MKVKLIPVAPQDVGATDPDDPFTFSDMEHFQAREIGERIAQARKLADLTQEQLADLLGLSLRSVQGYEAGNVIPWKHLREIASITQRPVDWFLHGELEDNAHEIRSLLRETLTRVRHVESMLERSRTTNGDPLKHESPAH